MDSIEESYNRPRRHNPDDSIGEDELEEYKAPN